MARSVLYMSMSLDGFITGPDDGPGNGLGNGGHRLHEWLGEPVSEHPHFDPPGLSGQVFAELMATPEVRDVVRRPSTCREQDRGEIGHARRHLVHVDVTGRIH